MRKLTAILLAGFVSGALDILSAFASYVSQGATVEGILKYIASGVLGPTAMQSGAAVAWLGLALHFALTTIMAAIFLFTALKIKLLTTRPWFAGSVYGVITWAVMVYVVVPLSGAPSWKLPQDWNIVSGLLAHIFYVGVPIAHITQSGLRNR
jgi:uncharacterized membrane protein YagU involved in acid resistance